MRVAIPHWQGRVSPVFDVAGRVLLIDIAGAKEQARQEVVVDSTEPGARANLLVDHGATVLICGAISWTLERILGAAGVEVISQICGDVEQILAAFLDGRLDQNRYLMPGCRGRGRRFRRRGRGGNTGEAGSLVKSPEIPKGSRS